MRVLIVEDDEVIARATKRILERHKHEYVHVRTLMDALKNISPFNPEAVILDLGLPDSNGIGTVKRIKDLLYDDTLVIVYTADAAIFPEVVEIGIDNFLDKGNFRPTDIPTVLKMAQANRRLTKALDRHQKLIRGEETTLPGTFPDTEKIGDSMISLAHELKLAVETG